MNRSVAIIPARGGSKRIPRKNIRSFLGRPIIEYSIQAALAAGCFDEVMVSTDDAEIAAVAVAAGAQVPFMRSDANANDMATTMDVLKEVMAAYQAGGKAFDFLCCIYPTAPLVTPVRLQEANRLLRGEQADCVLPVVRFGYPIQRALFIRNGQAGMMWPENYAVRSQDLEPAYHDAGQFYLMRTEALFSRPTLFEGRLFPVVMPESEVQDIDTEEDWKIAELKYRLLYPEKAPL